MQIRIANRQDEKKIRSLAQEISEEFDPSFDLESSDRDLKNVEANYFGRDGLFLVAEEEKEILGFAGASKASDQVCVLRRVAVAKTFRRRGIGRRLLAIVLSHAQRMGFDELELGINPYQTKSPEAQEGVDRFFASLGIVPASPVQNSVEKTFGGKFIFTVAH
jgi:N-acetylglutamate synthase-like GNAT family acetyltransferase